VPSRRLGQSIGINNIPPKICSYSCVYCQLGRTTKCQIDREAFYRPAGILRAVRSRVAGANESGNPVDFLTFVASGEPTLDSNLGAVVDLLDPLGIAVGVISNSSMMWDADAREDLAKADWVSLKVDAVADSTWREVNRPHKALRLRAIREGVCEFARAFDGVLTTETMLVKGLNDDERSLKEIASFIRQLDPATAYIAVPTRPPAENRVHAPDEQTLGDAYWIFRESLNHVEYLTGYEGNAFASTGNAIEDLLSITAVHPMREEAIHGFLKRAGLDWTTVDALVAERKLVELKHGGVSFYMRRILGPRGECIDTAGDSASHAGRKVDRR